ncbi:uroporphyrinogen-III synthase [Gaiella sp.]|uniref:uroporphyrinogen-III synthase n=1 Tax=Gaiella sp. TaxID=2663207 RepID=UPI003263CC3B
MRLIVTRPAGQEHDLITRLEALGHAVVHCPLIRIEPLSDEPIELGRYDWVVVTSPNGARELRRRARGSMPRVAAIGQATADAMGGADLVARVSTQEGLVSEMPRSAGRVLVAAAEGARTLLAEALGADFVPLYRTHALRPDPPPQGDVCLLASASAARAFGSLETGIPAVTIGPETTRAAREAGIAVLLEAPTHDVDGLVAAILLLDASA